MAGSKPGPAKGHGGRPRKKGGSRLTKGENKGYVKVTVGPPGKGKQEYKHRVVAGVVGKGYNTVVDHRNNMKSDDRKSNLKPMSRGSNTAKRNRDGGKPRRRGAK